MTSKINWTLSAVMTAASLLAVAPAARAQQTNLGSFTLPVEARIGGTTLPPGDYKVSRVLGLSGLRIAGEGGMATVLAAAVDMHANCDHSELTFTNVNGVYELKTFESGTLGAKFDFHVKAVSSRDAERWSAAHHGAAGQPASLAIPIK